jgi:hypothetical protein
MLFKPSNLQATAVAAIWFENAPPKVMMVLLFTFFACAKLYFNLNHLLPEISG